MVLIKTEAGQKIPHILKCHGYSKPIMLAVYSKGFLKKPYHVTNTQLNSRLPSAIAFDALEGVPYR